MIFAIVFFFYLVPAGTPKVTYWVVTGGGTAVSMLVGWWLASRGGKGRSETVAPTAPQSTGATGRLD